MARTVGSPPAAGPDPGPLTFDLDPPELGRRAMAILDRARRDLETLVGPGADRTVAALLEPLNRLLLSVRDLGSHGSLIFAVHAEPDGRAAGREISEAADRFYHEFRLDGRVYAALRGVPLEREDAPTRFAVEKLLREMRRAGVEKDDATRARLLELNRLIDVTANRFSENIATLERGIDVASVDELAGLPNDFLAAHPPGPTGQVRLTTRYTDFGPVMAYADRIEVRRRLLFEFANRAYPENLPVLTELLGYRHELATLLGYPDFASYAVEEKMMENPDAVRALLDRLRRLLDAPARADIARYLERKRKDVPGATRVEPWEAQSFGPGYYDQKIRTEEFGVDMRRLRTYLPYGRVRDGLFALCRELFDLEFRRSAASAWHPTVEVYDVELRGAPLGRAYFDLTPRDGKFSHAACFPVRDGLGGAQLPQAALVCNFLPPQAPAETARLEYPHVVTFFHEFGHLLHALLSGHQRWIYNSPSNLEWDFIEAPSQLFEEWARDPATLARFAVDPDTGEAVPRDLLERLRASESLGRPLGWLRQVALAAVSLDLYTGDPSGRDVSEASQQAWSRYAPEPLPADYHTTASFGHLTGYSACYYTYAWSAVIARDLLSPFFEHGSLTDRRAAARYAREILEPGSERHAAELVRAYLGRGFRFDAFERWVTSPAVLPGRAKPLARSRIRHPRRRSRALGRGTGSARVRSRVARSRGGRPRPRRRPSIRHRAPGRPGRAPARRHGRRTVGR